MMLALLVAAVVAAGSFQLEDANPWPEETTSLVGRVDDAAARFQEARLRFAPGFWEPESPAFWSYVMAWRGDGESPADAKRIARAVEAYYASFLEDAPKSAEPRPRPRFLFAEAPSGRHWVGAGAVTDFVVTGDPLGLSMEAATVDCPSGGFEIVFAASPQARGAPIWEALRAKAETLTCVSTSTR